MGARPCRAARAAASRATSTSWSSASPDRTTVKRSVKPNATQQAKFRRLSGDAGWLDSGSGSFHENVTSRPMLKLTLGKD